ncbi:Ig-like domain-containing protein [Bifidobacterium sp. ESL0682]|uniref:Ig-like domain-containing protein n=1 Tax=Bifidobacterium sp. ESL0682 TaxID=2983212 RepID=UPI0023F92D6C|nr:Ig-like domain-containing protein [Bifidobacterium sp. ESL0682]WEV42684.1 Ig-like domain-containing protein [Bifidobacterium sp. ESL0682]
MKASGKPQDERRFRLALRRLNSQTNRRWLTPVLVLLLLLGIVAGAIIINALTRTNVHLDDGTVWVTSLKDRKAARFNVKLQQANGAIAPTTPTFDVNQHDDNVVLSDGAKAQGIVASTLGIHGKSEVKSSTSTFMGGNTTAFLNRKTGNVWAGDSGNLDAIAPKTSSPQMQLGAHGLLAVDRNGAVYGYRPADGTVLKMDNGHSGVKTLKSITNGKEVNADSFTVIGDRPVIATKQSIMWQGGSAQIDSLGPITLQAPATDDAQGDWAAASASNGVFTVDFKHGNKVSAFMNKGTADPAQPVSSKGCVYTAWSQQAHNYIRLCSADGDANANQDKGDNTKAQWKSLQSISPTSQLVFRTNHRLVVLNDVTNGNIWNPDQSNKVIKIQWRQIEVKKTADQQKNSDSANNQTQFKPTCSTKSGAIKAQDDTFGARVGSQQILDVLRNDEQTDCSVLHITKVGPVSANGITVSPIYSGRYLQLDTTGATAGKATFTYEINDGRGQTSAATVNLNITDDTANQSPAQSDTPPEYEVEQGATFTVNALGSFTDPEGDPMTLVSAVAQNNNQVAVSTRADGQLVFNTGSLTGGRVAVEVTVSDGMHTGNGLIYFSVRPANTLPALIDAVTKNTTPDTSTTVELKQYVHGTSAQPHVLSSVNTPTGSTTSTNAADLSFTFKASNPGTYYVPYTISQGSVEAQGLARLEVQPVTGESAKPVAANDVALLGADRTAIVEPLNNDTDPLGGVLSVTSVSVDPKLGIKTGLVAHKRVYITARQIPTKPVKLTYTVANSAGSTRGTIVLQPPALTTANAAPKAANVTANVRTGGIVSVDVLDHVSHADGTTVKLQNALQYNKKTFKGLVFVSSDEVRYQASNTPGVYPVTYTVRDNLGNAASDTITITVHTKDANNKPAPTPQDTQAQVAAGQKVRIPITLTGIDADGDDDTLLGLGDNSPKMGRIDEVGANYMVYEAYSDSSGTDAFSYAVEDWTGQRAQAQIRMGVYKGTSDSGVYARDDQVTLRPNTAANVPVTQNDISGDNTDLSIDKNLQVQGIDEASVADNMISFKTPSQAGTSYIVYTVKDKAGLSDTATLTVITDPNAPIEPPTAYDYRVPSSATLDKKSIDVDLSQWIANPSGTTDELKVGIDPTAADHARVKGGDKSTTVTIDLTDEARSVPYTVTNTTYHITSTAFVQVPQYGVFPPTLRPKAPPIKVNAKRSVNIDLADYVRVGPGKTPYVDKDSISATKSANSDYYVNDQTLKFTAPKDYAGPASITFTVYDGKHDANSKDKNGSKQAKIINSSVLTLPITVIGRNVPPPTFSSSTISVAAGEEAKTVDLKALTHAPSGLDEDEKNYSYSGGEASGSIESHLTSGGKLTIKSPADATVGSISSIPITIKYSNGTVSAGLTAQVVQSTRPLAQISGVSRRMNAGDSTTVNILSGAFNPFPGTPLNVVSCQADDTAKLKVDCGAKGTIVIRAAADIGASSNTVVVNVQDATHTKEREVSTTITVSVIDKPAPPLLSPVAGQPADGAVNLSWTPGSANGSPISEYVVDWGGQNKSCGAVTTCNINGLTNGKAYRFSVRARNEAGWSKPSNTVEGMPDKVPDAPSGVRVTGGYQQVTVSWDAPGYTGTKPDDYTVTMNGKVKHTSGLSQTFNLGNGEITDGAVFSATVRAHNRAGDGPLSYEASTGGNPAWGDPDQPMVSMRQNAGGDTMSINVTLGNMRNAGCGSIDVSGDFSPNITCNSLSDTVHVEKRQYNTRQRISVVVNPKRAARPTPAASAEATPGYSVQAPSIGISRNNDQCRVNIVGKGEYDGFSVNNGAQTSNTSVQYATASPWSTCADVSVSQLLNGSSGPSATAQSNDIYKKKANISSDLKMQWVPGDRHKINVTGGNVDTYNGHVTASLTISVDGKDAPCTGWQPGQAAACDVTALGDDDYDNNDFSWKIEAIIADAGSDTQYNDEKTGTRVEGIRQAKTATPSDPSTSPVPSSASVPGMPGDLDTPSQVEAESLIEHFPTLQKKRYAQSVHQ